MKSGVDLGSYLHPVTLVEVFDEAYQLGVDASCLQHKASHGGY